MFFSYCLEHLIDFFNMENSVGEETRWNGLWTEMISDVHT
jgi:hypothetical protein